MNDLDLLPGPEDLFELAEMHPEAFFEEASGTLAVLATVAGYNTGMHPAVALTAWCTQVAQGIRNTVHAQEWAVMQAKFATRLEERVHGE